jgi:guanylate kinase
VHGRSASACPRPCRSSSLHRRSRRFARLVGRGTDAPQDVARRLATAREELAAEPEFGHVVVNDRLEGAVAELESIVRGALRCPLDSGP